MDETKLLQQITHLTRLIKEKESSISSTSNFYNRNKASKTWSNANRFKIAKSFEPYNVPKNNSLTYSKLKVIQNCKENEASCSSTGQRNLAFNKNPADKPKHFRNIPELKSNIHVNPAKLVNITTDDQVRSCLRLPNKIYINREMRDKEVSKGNQTVRRQVHVNKCFIKDIREDLLNELQIKKENKIEHKKMEEIQQKNPLKSGINSTKPSKVILLSKTKLVRQKGTPSNTKTKWVAPSNPGNLSMKSNLKSSATKKNPYKFVANDNGSEFKAQCSKFKYIRQRSPKKSPSKIIVTPASKGRNFVKKNTQKLSLTSPLVSVSRMKMIRNSSSLKRTFSANKKVFKAPNKGKTKFKIVNNRSQFSQTYYKARSIVTKYKLARNVNRYKIDRRVASQRKQTSRKTVRFQGLTQESLMRRKLFNSRMNKLWYCNLPPQLRRKLINKGRRVYKDGVVRLNGERFHISGNGRTLKRLGSGSTKLTRLNLGGVTFVRSSNGDTFQKTDHHVVRNRAMMAKQRSIMFLTKKLRKNNQPCLIYNKFGQCSGKNKGTCDKVHDPKRIAICRKFLRGVCESKTCLLSHDVDPAKMPTCRHYLAGVCVRDDCPYLHVKVNSSAPVCIPFLQGYCPDADKCKKRHVPICPTLEKSGSCTKKNCPYPHPKANSKRSKVLKQTNLDNPSDKKNKVSNENIELTSRYYNVQNKEEKVNEIESICQVSGDENEEIGHEWLNKRPKIGQLPSFIPLS